jgi:ribosomal protein S18 acetylase RimI-like enzyme
MWRLYFQLSPEGKKRYFQEILPLLHDTKAEVLGDRDHDAWYLVYLGTKPNSQGRGYAARLLQDMMARVRLILPIPPSFLSFLFIVF